MKYNVPTAPLLPLHFRPSELKILAHLAIGESPEEIAAVLGLSLKTVKNQKAGLAIVLGSPKPQKMIAVALRHNVLHAFLRGNSFTPEGGWELGLAHAFQVRSEERRAPRGV